MTTFGCLLTQPDEVELLGCFIPRPNDLNKLGKPTCFNSSLRILQRHKNLLPESEAYNKDTFGNLQPVLSLFSALISFIFYLLFFCSRMTRISFN